MSKYETLDYSFREGVATIVMSRPEASNAINEQMQLDLLKAITSASNDNETRVVVIAGAGKNFSAGADLLDRIKKPDCTASALLEEYFKPILMAIYNAKKPFISAINGAAAGVASALAMVCDLTVMAEDACIYQAFSKISLIPDGGACWHLVQQLGYRRAYEMIIEGEKISAETCMQLGLTNRVVPSDQLMEYTQNWAKELTLMAPLTLGYSKEALQNAQLTDLSRTINDEGRIQDIIMQSHDAKEGISAFFEKRPPVFLGK